MEKGYRKSQHSRAKRMLCLVDDVALYIGCGACMALFFLFFAASSCPGWTFGQSLGLFPLQYQYADYADSMADMGNTDNRGAVDLEDANGYMTSEYAVNWYAGNGYYAGMRDSFSNTASQFSSVIIRGQSNESYWNSVYTPYAQPTYVAQSTSAAASTQPSITQPSAASSGPIVSSPSTLSSTSGGSIAMDPSTTAPPLQSGFTEPVQKIVRFCNNFMFDYTFIPRGNDGLGINDLKVSSRFMLPCNVLPASKENQESNFFFIAPAFSVDFWSNPKHSEKSYFDMPNSTFDGSFAFGLNPQFNKDFSMEAWVQLGIASSFKKINKHAFYLRGLATGTLSITENGSFKATGGIKYLDRNRYKLLPVAGVIWTPNEKNVWRLVFPDPKLSHHLGKNNETDWWAYICGDIGGGRWLVDAAGETFNIDYNDYRFGGGLTFVRSNSFTGHFEVGGAFGRELYALGTKLYKPQASVYLKAGLGF